MAFLFVLFSLSCVYCVKLQSGKKWENSGIDKPMEIFCLLQYYFRFTGSQEQKEQQQQRISSGILFDKDDWAKYVHAVDFLPRFLFTLSIWKRSWVLYYSYIKYIWWCAQWNARMNEWEINKEWTTTHKICSCVHNREKNTPRLKFKWSAVGKRK